MPYKNLEHDGVNILNIGDREEVKKEENRREEVQEKQKQKHLDVAQDAYMNLENPALWEGEM